MHVFHNVPQEELLDKLREHVASGQVAVCNSEEEQNYSEAIRKYFSNYFPYEGAVIYRPYIPNASSEKTDDNDFSSAYDFFDEIVKEAGLKETDVLVVLWDDASYAAIRLSVEILRMYLRDFLHMPPHMYVVPADVSWCACFRMEGDMGFGFGPASG